MLKAISGLVFLCLLATFAQAQLNDALAPKVVSANDKIDDASESGDLLDAHNAVRQAHGVADLVWDESLEAYAQEWADHLARNSCRAEHRPNQGEMAQQHGENLYWASPLAYPDGTSEAQKVSGAYVANSWAKEENDYDYVDNTCAPGKACGHYTQMVWANSTKLGCARSICADQSQIWVCNYSPRGNYASERPYGDSPKPTRPALAVLTPIGVPDRPTRESTAPGAIAYQDLRATAQPYYVQCSPEDTELGRLAVVDQCGRLNPPAAFDAKVFSPNRIKFLRSRLDNFDQDVAAYRRCTTQYISTYRQDGYDATSRTAYEAACAHNWAEVELTSAAANYVQACYHYNDHAPAQGYAAFDSRCIP